MIATSSALKVGVVGCGYFGQLHAGKYAALPQAELVAVADCNPAAASALAEKLNCDAVVDATELIGRVDAVSVVVPTAQHFAVAAPLLEAGLHMLIEKPIAATVEQAAALVDLAARHDRVLQVGHVERFNAAIIGLEDVIRDPLFIEVDRIAPFKLRGTDVDVILDLMIHDIDLIQHLVRAPVKRVDAVGVPVLSGNDDIANVRLHFEDDCVANVTASRVGLKQERKMRLFQKDAYISIDFQAATALIARRGEGEMMPGIPSIDIDHRNFESNDPLAREIEAFVEAVAGRGPIKVSGHDGLRALQTAVEITRTLKRPAVS